MNLLLDTHALIWWLTRSASLSARASAAIDHADNRVHVSAASAWEIATKVRLGKLQLPGRALATFDELPELAGFVALDVDWRHAALAGSWKIAHRDPFDRLLAAQSKLERLAIVTMDPAFRAFAVKTLW